AALAHFRARDADDDGVVGPHHHPGIDLGRQRLRRGLIGERNMEAEREPGGGRRDQKGAAVDAWHLVHGCLPHALAAAGWTARRPCGWAPRRRLLGILASMSASAGFGSARSSAATAMIMPAWQ